MRDHHHHQHKHARSREETLKCVAVAKAFNGAQRTGAAGAGCTGTSGGAVHPPWSAACGQPVPHAATAVRGSQR